jgi:glycerophosphoryl diester phosphodiesterase
MKSMTGIFAHRGASAYAPENCMDAFRLAADMGADGIEIDVHMTKDGHVVVAHDAETDRVTGQPGSINSLTLAQLREMNFAAHFGGYAQIPTLEETLEFIKPTNLQLNIEIKAGPVIYHNIEGQVLKMVGGFGLNDRTIYSSFNHYGLKIMKAMDPAAKIGLLYSSALYEPWHYASYVKADAIHPYYVTLLAPGVVEGCHSNGIAVNPWTVDEPEHIKMLLMLGVDNIITNKPDVAKAIRDAMAK